MNILDVIIYIAIALTGTVFGSFFTLAVHRIPKNQDITHQRSYCPKCNHKLNALDLIPVFSYIFLGGKCRYCKEKIRPRYLILEVLSGLFFVLLACFKGINYFSSVETCVFFVLDILFVAALIIIAGIDADIVKIDSRVVLYGGFVGAVKLIALGLFGYNLKHFVMGFLFLTFVWMIASIIGNKLAKNKEDLEYWLGIISMFAVIGLFMGSFNLVLGFPLFFFLLGVYFILNSALGYNEKIPVGFIISVVYGTLMILL